MAIRMKLGNISEVAQYSKENFHEEQFWMIFFFMKSLKGFCEEKWGLHDFNNLEYWFSMLRNSPLNGHN